VGSPQALLLLVLVLLVLVLLLVLLLLVLLVLLLHGSAGAPCHTVTKASEAASYVCTLRSAGHVPALLLVLVLPLPSTTATGASYSV
jgi:hypothetical protein